MFASDEASRNCAVVKVMKTGQQFEVLQDCLLQEVHRVLSQDVVNPLVQD